MAEQILRCQCTRDRPALAKAAKQGGSVEIEPFSPFSDSKRLPIVGNGMRGAAIATLLDTSSPSAVARLITAIVVNAVNRMIRRWSRSNIITERSEIVSPLIANSNATTAIVVKVAVIIVYAAFDNLRPHFVFWRTTSVVFCDFIIALRHVVTAVTAATFGQISRQIGGGYRCFGAAFADATPHSMLAALFNKRHDGPTIEGASDQVSFHRLLLA